MSQDKLDAHYKALQVNLDPAEYGTFAEIGAGQEVARWFFRVGGAAGTIAKAMSAYDMTFSDAIYGPSDRYVGRRRLQTMLDHEYALLIERLDAQRGPRTKFFVFANTVATRSYSRKQDGHGWLGIRFQTAPSQPPSDITIHVTLKDTEAEQQQEALGLIGVNLVYGALFLHADPPGIIRSLLDNLTSERVEVDMVDFKDPAFDGGGQPADEPRARAGGPDRRRDVHRRRARRAALRRALQEVHPDRARQLPARRPRSPWTCCEGAQAQFVQEPGVQGGDVEVLLEMTLNNLRESRTIASTRRTFSSAPTRSRRSAGRCWCRTTVSTIASPLTCTATRVSWSASSWACRRCASCSTRSTTRTSTAAFSSRSAGCSRTT